MNTEPEHRESTNDAIISEPRAAAYAHVLLDVANRRLDRVYTYSIPPDLPVAVGMTVLVPLQNRQVRGMVAYVSDVLPEEVREVTLRPVIRVLERENIMPAELLELAFWLSETVMCPIAQSLHAVWPFWRQKIEKWAVPQIRLEDVADWRESQPDCYLAVQVLLRARRGGLPLHVYCERLREKGISGDAGQLLEHLAGLGVLRWEIRVSNQSKTQIDTVWGRQDDEETQATEGTQSAEGMQTAEETQTVEETQTGCTEVGQAASVEMSPKINNERSHTDNAELAHRVFELLSPSQKEAVQKVLLALKGGEGATILLHGVTGSGKTLVYRALVAEVVAQGRDAVILVPEISLTSQVARHFLADYGEQAAVVHSKLSAADKQKIWADVLAGKIKVVIGARSAVFAPFAALGIVIMDEEHDSAYQQEENPKYHARDVARRRVRRNGGVLLLGSATPSLESYAAARTGKIKLLELTERFSRRPLPYIHIVDMARELARGNKSIFSQMLIRKIAARLAQGEQCILFLNRRGYATYVFCRECGYVAKCPRCDVAMTYHSQKQILLCHYCDHQAAVDHHCPECGSIYLKFFGQGTQRLEEEIAACFPAARVLRLDTDATQRRGQNAHIIDTFRRREVDILVGTQMLAKGLDFPEVTLVGVVLADPLLNMPDFRARERAFQLLTQVAGRAGRHDKPGEVILQTYMPKDPVLLHVADHDYRSFFHDEIAFRHGAVYPPFAHFIRVTVLHENEERVAKAAQELAGSLRSCLEESLLQNQGLNQLYQGRQDPNVNNTQERETQEMGEARDACEAMDVQILGPAPAVLSKLRNTFRWQILIKGKRLALLRKIAHRGIERFYGTGAAGSGVALNIEVNPIN